MSKMLLANDGSVTRGHVHKDAVGHGLVLMW